jgi:cystathionine beta-lyase/cystathionine gamma-synthase
MKQPTLVNHPPAVVVPQDNRPLVAPIYQSVKFSFDDVDETLRNERGERAGFFYSRVSNPTLRQLELTLAQLQGRDGCLLTASGVAAVNLAMLALCKQSDHVIVCAEMYKPTRAMARRVLGRYGVSHSVLSLDDLDGLRQTLASRPTRLLVFESPTNPMLKIAEIQQITALARAHGALTMLDNTLAGFHNHGQYDIDVYVHSLTKYASGHGDVMGGAVIADSKLIDAIRSDFILTGPVLDPHAAFLIQRGLKTYCLRYQRQCENALAVARFLEARAQVTQVRYPGLASHPQHPLAKAQMKDFGTMVVFEIAGTPQQAQTFAESLRLFTITSSLGSTESLVLPPQLLQPGDLNAAQRKWSQVTERTVRLSLGIEDIDDLLADLDQALAKTFG